MTEGCEDQYCYAYGSAFDNWIEEAHFGTQFLTSEKDYGYNNFTATPIDTLTSNELTIELIPGSEEEEETTTVFWSVWIDFNQDKEFYETTERILFEQSDNKTPVFSTLIMPEITLPGATRLRIAMDVGEAQDACGISGLREVEDYTLLGVTSP